MKLKVAASGWRSRMKSELRQVYATSPKSVELALRGCKLELFELEDVFSNSRDLTIETFAKVCFELRLPLEYILYGEYVAEVKLDQPLLDSEILSRQLLQVSGSETPEQSDRKPKKARHNSVSYFVSTKRQRPVYGGRACFNILERQIDELLR